uniref:Uncharacterized protein n=1 Tax=Fagus sylvatica TaxID=28930 RepID=A0A2N9ICR8_FAGSY
MTGEPDVWDSGLAPPYSGSSFSCPSRLPLLFPLARRWDSAWIQRLTVRTLQSVVRRWIALGMPTSSSALSTFLERLEVFRAELLVCGYGSDPRSWELLMGERTLRQLGGLRHPDLADVPYREWFEQVSLGSLMSLHELELSVSEDRYTADMAEHGRRMQTDWRQGEMVQGEQRDLDSRDASCLSGLGQTSSSPPPDPVSRDWFFDDPSPP